MRHGIIRTRRKTPCWYSHQERSWDGRTPGRFLYTESNCLQTSYKSSQTQQLPSSWLEEAALVSSAHLTVMSFVAAAEERNMANTTRGRKGMFEGSRGMGMVVLSPSSQGKDCLAAPPPSSPHLPCKCRGIGNHVMWVHCCKVYSQLKLSHQKAQFWCVFKLNKS